MRAVYPRSRGEHSGSLFNPDHGHGLSPLTRGTRAQARGDVPLYRFIPAHAGNTQRRGTQPGNSAVYPRSRGEHPVVFPEFIHDVGLSPLTRGTLLITNRNGAKKRFIPAHAGNTFVQFDGGVGDAVYPRSRGEHFSAVANSGGKSGLSPLTRGTPVSLNEGIQFIRFIPAHAGNTSRKLVQPNWVPVYPRSRGEHLDTACARVATAGLSPLTRGTLPLAAHGVHGLRFIPAHAGNTIVIYN